MHCKINAYEPLNQTHSFTLAIIIYYFYIDAKEYYIFYCYCCIITRTPFLKHYSFHLATHFSSYAPEGNLQAIGKLFLLNLLCRQGLIYLLVICSQNDSNADFFRRKYLINSVLRTNEIAISTINKFVLYFLLFSLKLLLFFQLFSTCLNLCIIYTLHFLFFLKHFRKFALNFIVF